jgi:hypothetical protein
VLLSTATASGSFGDGFGVALDLVPCRCVHIGPSTPRDQGRDSHQTVYWTPTSHTDKANAGTYMRCYRTRVPASTGVD